MPMLVVVPAAKGGFGNVTKGNGQGSTQSAKGGFGNATKGSAPQVAKGLVGNPQQSNPQQSDNQPADTSFQDKKETIQ